MALYSNITSDLNVKPLGHYPPPAMKHIHHLLANSLRKVSNVDRASPIRLSQRLARSFSVDEPIHLPICKRAYSRTNSLSIRSPPKKHRRIEEQSQCSTSVLPNLQSLPLTEQDTNDLERHYSTKRPYPRPSQDHVLSSPPAGYRPIGIQVLARHGSRTMNSHDYDQRVLRVWHIAKQQNRLTTFGEQLRDDIELFMKANDHIGRGELTQLGRDEHYGLGTRLQQRLQTLFHHRSAISVITSGKNRAIDSSQEFLRGCTNTTPTIEIVQEMPNKKLLYFHKCCPNYFTFKSTNAEIRKKLESIKNAEQTRHFAQQILKNIFQEEFVELLIQGDYQDEHDENNDRTGSKTEVDLVLCLYLMFAIAPAHSSPYLSQLLAKYFNREQSNWFAYVNDAQEFYVKGPSIEGTSVTYDMATPLLADFFSSIAASIDDGEINPMAIRLRFAHAETVIPFATLLQIPGLSDKPTDPSDLYTYEKNPWRGDRIAPMAANIQWEIYRHETYPNQILIRMLYNELEVRFKEDCQPVLPDSFFYELNEVQRAYAHLLQRAASCQIE